MKLKNLILIGMCAIAATAFAAEPFLPEGGTLLFYENFNSGATADSNTDDKYMVEGKTTFYVYSPGEIYENWFNPSPLSGEPKPDPTPRWDYPSNSFGNVWRPNAAPGNPSFEFQLNTGDFEYAYLSLASLFWGNYIAYYSFDDWATEHVFSRDFFYRSSEPMPYVYLDCGGECQHDWNWWYDQFIENIGGKPKVNIRIKCIAGNPLQMDDVQVTGYAKEIVFKAALSDKIEEAEKFYEDNEGDESYCPSKVARLPAVIEAAKPVAGKANATQQEINEVLLPLSQAFTSAQDRSRLDPDAIEGDDPLIIQNFEKAYSEAYALKDRIEEALDLPKEVEEAFLDALAEAGSMGDDYCDADLMKELTELLPLLVAEIENYISVEGVTNLAGVYPNPASDYIRIADVAGVTVYIFNAMGQQVLSVSNYNGGVIQVSNLASGVYTAAYGKQTVTFIKR